MSLGAAVLALAAGCAPAPAPLESAPAEGEAHAQHAPAEPPPATAPPEVADPYTGLPYGPASCDADHIVAAREAWESGGQAWPVERRRAFGADPANLTPSRDCANRSKGSADVGSWAGVASGSCAGAALAAALARC